MQAAAIDGASAPPKTMNTLFGLQAFLALDSLVRLVLWSSSLALTTALFGAWFGWPDKPFFGSPLAVCWTWTQKLATWVIIYHNVYLLEIIALRVLIPTPREGVYVMGRKPDRQLVWACLIAVLTKARYEAPFPGFLMHQVASLPPFFWLLNYVFGPRSQSVNVTDPHIIDPHMVTLGRNVVIGFQAMIAGHVQERDRITIRRTVIEDDVLIGGYAVIPGGVHIKSGSMIGAMSLIMPNTVIGPNEFWAGIPARKIRDLPPPGTAAAEAPPSPTAEA